MNNKCKIALKSFMIGIITGVTVIYIVQFVIKIIKGAKLKEAVKVDTPWITYYTSGIAGGISGFLQPFISSELFPFCTVLIAVAVYNGLLIFTNEDDLINNTQDNLTFTIGIIRDIFLVIFIVYVLKLITGNKKDDKKNNFNDILITSIANSIFISISFSLSQEGINNILGLTNSLNVALTDE